MPEQSALLKDSIFMVALCFPVHEQPIESSGGVTKIGEILSSALHYSNTNHPAVCTHTAILTGDFGAHYFLINIATQIFAFVQV